MIMDRYELVRLYDIERISRLVGSDLKADKLYQSVLRLVLKGAKVQEAFLFLWKEQSKSLELGAAVGVKGIKTESLSLKIDKKAAITAVAKDRKPCLLNRTDYRKLLGIKGKKIASSLSLPLVIGNRLSGVLTLNRRAGGKKFSQEEQKRVSLLCEDLVIVIANVQGYIDSEIRNKHLFRFNVVGRALNSTVDEQEIKRILSESLKGVINFDIYTLLLIHKDGCSLQVKSEQPISKSLLNNIKEDLLRLIGNLVQQPLDPSRIRLETEFRRKSSGKGELKGRVRSYLNAPLVSRDRVIGMFNLNSLKDDAFGHRDQQNLSTLASQAAVAFENARLYNSLRRTYFSIIRALTAAIEAKDPYTRGHSDSVSEYANALAEELKLSRATIESVQIAGILHDLGKIGIPEEILQKPGSLTSQEYEAVRAHPEIALKILGPVEFPRFVKEPRIIEVRPELTLKVLEPADLSAEVKLIIYHHHERYGGGGYPKGLAGEEIPLGARILAVADAFEAMTSDRPYRRAFSLEEAKLRLSQASGSQLDPKLVKTFLRLLDEKKITEKVKSSSL